MIRDPTALDQEFDLLVVGGGIYGAWTAWDAALRGLRTALVEANDWASATSSRSSKLLHGGLRYLERGDVGLVRKALVERERLLRLGPHRTWPLHFVVPATPGARYRGLPLALGLWAYDHLAPPGLGERRARPWTGHEVLGAAPFLHPGTTSAWTYGDAGTDDARLVLELVDGVLRAGGVAVNGARVTRLVECQGRIAGAEVACDGRNSTVRARSTVVCAGPWAAQVAGLDPGSVRLTKGIHVALPPLPVAGPWATEDTAFLLNHPTDGRVFFLIPWYGMTLVGTTDTDTTDPHEGVTEGEIAYLLAGGAAACPGLGWGRGDVRSAWAGVRTLLAAQGHASAISREWSLVRRPGLFASLGGKLTSARIEAERIVDAVEDDLGRPRTPSPTRTQPLPWCPTNPWPEACAEAIRHGQAWGWSPARSLTALRRHGQRLGTLWLHLEEHPDDAKLLHPDLPLCRGELALAAQNMLLPDQDPLARTPVGLLVGNDVSRGTARPEAGPGPGG